MAEYEISARKLLCPMPVIRTQDAIAKYQKGDILHVFGTDPGMKQDIPAWCRINGHTIIDMIDHEDDIEIIIEVGDVT